MFDLAIDRSYVGYVGSRFLAFGPYIHVKIYQEPHIDHSLFPTISWASCPNDTFL